MLDRNTIHCMDALEFLKSLPDSSIDMAITSPPYDNLRTYKGYVFDFEGIAQQAYRVLKPGAVLVWVVGDSVVDGSETLSSFEQVIYFRKTVGFNVHDTMIWSKDGAPYPESNRYLQTFEYMFVLSKGTPYTYHRLVERTKYGGSKSCSGRNVDGTTERFKYELAKPFRSLDNVWYIPTGYMKTTTDKAAYEHPAMFPEELARRHIYTWSNPGDLVMDFFMGSGTTAKMARSVSRDYIGCDISPEYVAIAQKRLDAPYTLPLLPEETAREVYETKPFELEG